MTDKVPADVVCSGGDDESITTAVAPAWERGILREQHQTKVKHEYAWEATEPDVSSHVSSEEKGGMEKGDVFDQDGLEHHYAPIEAYEGRHRYDPKATWSDEEEQRLVRRLDFRICAFICFMFFALQLDRANIAQANSNNFLHDLGMTTNDFNTGQTIFHVTFLIAELPSQLVSKKLGPDNWIPIQMVTWSVVAMSQSRISNRSTFFLTRALLGALEGGFVPDAILYLSYFYKSKELPIRLSYFFTAFGMTFVISALLGAGILRLDGYDGWHGWQWLFILEGALTALIGLLAFFYLPPSPTQTASFFRGQQGWFTAREETIMVNRILRDDPSKGDMHNRQAVTPRLLWEALKDYDMWPLYLLGLTWDVPSQVATNYLTLILRGLGFDTFDTNLLTIPAYVLFSLQLLLITWLSERYNNRYAFVLYVQFYMLPLVIALEVLGGGHREQWARYVLNMMLVGYPFVHAIITAMTSRNSGSVKTRTVSIAVYNMCVQTAAIIGANVYRTKDAPLYRTGNKVLIGIIAWNVAVIIGSKAYYIWCNKSRERVWNAMSRDEKDTYLRTTTDRGNKRLDFRFTH